MAKRKLKATPKSKGSGCGINILATILIIIVIVVIFSPKEPKPSTSTSNSSSGDSQRVEVTTTEKGTGVKLEPSATITDTPPAIQVSIPLAVRANSDVVITPLPAVPLMYVMNTANARTCPSTDCEVVGTFEAGETFGADGITRGETTNGSALWYRTKYIGQTVYVNTSLAINYESVAQPQQNQSQVQQQQPPPVSQPVAGSPFGCNGMNDLNCADFSSGGADAHLQQCGDEDDLDRDGDGDACEQGWN